MRPLLLSILLSWQLIVQAQPVTPYSVSGVITEQTGTPLESATVSLLRAKDSIVTMSLKTSISGTYVFTGVKAGRYFLQVTAVGHGSFTGEPFIINAGNYPVTFPVVSLSESATALATVSVVSRKSFIEQKTDRMIVNVDASPSNAGSTAMDVLEKTPGVTVDKDDNISLKGKQNVVVMIDDKPTYMTAAQLASYLKGLPASALDKLEIMTNPSAKYDAAGNAGIINIRTKKNRTRGFNGSLSLNETQSKFAKPGGSLNLNYRNGKFNVFANAGYNRWKGWHQLDLTRKYFDPGTKDLNSTFTQETYMEHTSPELNLKAGMDYFLSDNTTIGVVYSGFRNDEKNNSRSFITLKDATGVTDSIVHSYGNIEGRWTSNQFNLNFRHKFDSTGTEITADADFVRYDNGNDQHYNNLTYNTDMSLRGQTELLGHLPSTIDIYTFKSDFSQTLNNKVKMEAGVKTSYVATDNHADYFNIVNQAHLPDSGKTNYFVYHENINAAYLNLSRSWRKWDVQAGVRVENTNYSGHQFGNIYTAKQNDSSFSRNYINAFPTIYVTYKLNDKNSFTANIGRRIDRPDYASLNPFLFFLDQYTYQAGNPYLQPQYSTNAELSHTWHGYLTTTLNYSETKNFFSETFQQEGHATIVRNGNIGNRKNAGASVSFNYPVTKWWTTSVYTNVNYTRFTGMLYGENLDIHATTFLGNLNNQFTVKGGWSGELSGFYRSPGVEGQVYIRSLGQVSAAVAKQILKEKGSLKLGIRDIFNTQRPHGTIDFQETQATFYNTRDSRQATLTFTYRFGKPLKGIPETRHSGGAGEEANRVRSGGNN